MDMAKARQEIDEKLGKTWDREELLKEFEVLGFSMGFCVVKNKTTGEKGSLTFNSFALDDGLPVRLYHNFVKG